MYEVMQEVPFCYGHRLLEHKGRCARLHGHNGVAVIVLRRADLDRQGMVVDFDDIEMRVRSWVDRTLDHTMLLNENDPLVAVLSAHDEPFLGVPFNPTAEQIARMIFEYVLSEGFPVTEVRLKESDGSIAAYRP